MKMIALLGLVLISPSVIAATPPGLAPFVCGKPAQLALVEKAVVAEIRSGASNSYSFHFSPVYQSKESGDLVVYYEQVDGDRGEFRVAHAAQYKVDPKTCKPTSPSAWISPRSWAIPATRSRPPRSASPRSKRWSSTSTSGATASARLSCVMRKPGPGKTACR